ncbi:MAG: hypothetical protein IKR99_05755 [Lachnospiraceae bacterium]|nr:hypothetical protein [Lachnospiraceae bacterium]
MKVCEWCGATFDPEEAEEYFDDNTFGLSYGNVKKCLCGECAVQAINDCVDGVYFETCEKCGQEFDLIIDEGEYASHFGFGSATLRDSWQEHYQILCADCAYKVWEEEHNEFESENEDDEVEDEDDDF